MTTTSTAGEEDVFGLVRRMQYFVILLNPARLDIPA